MNDHDLTQKALADVAIMKRALRQINEHGTLSASSFQTHLLISLGLLVFTLVFAGIDMIDGRMTSALMISSLSRDMQREGINQVGLFLMLVTGATYAFLALQARKQEQPVSTYAARSFSYFKNLSFLSDVFVKYAVFSLVILAGKPEWVAGLLVLFTGDLVFQGRFFVFSALVSGIIGIACFVLTFYMLHHHVVALIWPLTVFAVITCLNIVNLLRMSTRQTTADA